MTIVLERLDESLVVAARYLNWSIADVVAASSRKSLSTHPSHKSWPQEAVALLKSNLELLGAARLLTCLLVHLYVCLFGGWVGLVMSIFAISLFACLFAC